nr:hypothetical protein [Halorientalis pallida]
MQQGEESGELQKVKEKVQDVSCGLNPATFLQPLSLRLATSYMGSTRHTKHKPGDTMHREVTTTVRVKLHSLTEWKARLVEREYSAFQDAVHGEDANLYSATKQQAGKVRSNKNPREDTEQPVVLRNDCISIEHDEATVLSSWWFKFPVYNPEKEKGDNIWVPIHVPEKDTHLLTDESIRDSELVRRDGEWYVHLVCKRSVAVADEYDDVLAVDMGAKWIAVSTFLSDRDTEFHGAEVRRVREHYKQLRKSSGKRRCGREPRSSSGSVTRSRGRSTTNSIRWRTN